ncbi:hexokinase-1-like [Sycon ciliatum]|uniref:hexokinase-1-like n=1 Tax=Sycon ciliatum TaxID=27933 RepID=UPI0031F6024C
MTTVDAVLEPFVLSKERLQEIKKRLLSEMEDGLAREGATIRMLPTYVHDLPDGTEKGKFLALDLGGSNFRVLLISLDGRSYTQTDEPKFEPLSDDVKATTQEALFDHIAECLQKFVDANGITEKLPLGFTFSFPVLQTGLTKGTLIKWTKGFRAVGAEKHDIIELLRAALKRRQGIEVDVVALVNDTTGTMMSNALQDADCHVGLILGTGTNACYMERLDAVKKWSEPRKPGVEHIAINTEWGAFGDNGTLDDVFTEFDNYLDQNVSINKGDQKFEKTISGMYLGELVRVICLRLHSLGLLFKDQADIPKFQTAWEFLSKYLSDIETGDVDESLPATRAILSDMGVASASDDDCRAVRRVCEAVSTRAAHLAAAGVSTIVEKIDKTRKCSVAVDGSLYKKHPKFAARMDAGLDMLLPAGHGVKMQEATDGSGRGAALVAAVACRLTATASA